MPSVNVTILLDGHFLMDLTNNGTVASPITVYVQKGKWLGMTVDEPLPLDWPSTIEPGLWNDNYISGGYIASCQSSKLVLLFLIGHALVILWRLYRNKRPMMKLKLAVFVCCSVMVISKWCLSESRISCVYFTPLLLHPMFFIQNSAALTDTAMPLWTILYTMLELFPFIFLCCYGKHSSHWWRFCPLPLMSI